MKKGLFLLIMMGTFSLFAQDAAKKPSLAKAEMNRKNGKLDEAKAIIDMAIVHEKTKEKGKTWYYRGLIYTSLDTTSNEQFKSLSENPLQTAVEAFDKAKEIKPGDQVYFISDPNNAVPVYLYQQIITLNNYYQKTGFQFYSSKDYKSAVPYFEKMAMLNPGSTTGYLYCGDAAEKAKMYDVVVRNYKNLVKIDTFSKAKDFYGYTIDLITRNLEDYDQALELAKEARAKFPNDQDLLKKELTIYILAKRTDEAISSLKKAIEGEPSNVNLYISLAQIYDEKGKVEDNQELLDLAKTTYEKAHKTDPDNFYANFNLGIYFYNKGADKKNKANEMGLNQASAANKLKSEAKSDFQSALPYFIKAKELEPKDASVYNTLEKVYLQLGKYDDADAVVAEAKSQGLIKE